MKMLLLYSDVDDFIIITFVAITGVLFLFNWILIKLKSRKKIPFYWSENDISENDLSNYKLSFDNTEVNSKAIGFKSKLILFVLSLILVMTPLYEFIETLRPQEFFYNIWSCLPF